MGKELHSKVAEIKAIVATLNTPQQQSQVEQSLSAPDPCQPEIDALGALMEELGTFLDSWEPRFLEAEEALQCCRIANPGSGPP